MPDRIVPVQMFNGKVDEHFCGRIEALDIQLALTK